MATPEMLRGMSLPVIDAPMFIVSNPELVIAQCINGVVGSFTAFNACPQAALDNWLAAITSKLDAFTAANPGTEVAPFAVNQIIHKSNDRLADDLALCSKYKTPIIITSLSAPTEVVPRVHEWGGVVFHDVINVRHAEKAVEAGVDGLILVCAGAGGHAPEPIHLSPLSRRCAGSGPVRSPCPAPLRPDGRSRRPASSGPISPMSARVSSPPPRRMPIRATSR